MDSRPVAVIITADGCGACTNFKANGASNSGLNQAKQVLTELGFHVVHLNKPNMREPLPGYLELEKFITGYPGISFFTRESWEAMSNRTGPLVGQIMQITSLNDLTPEKIRQFVHSSLKISKGSQQPKPQTGPQKYPTIGSYNGKVYSGHR